MIAKLTGYRDDKGHLEVEVQLESGALRTFVVREDELYDGQLAFTPLPPAETPSWRGPFE